MIIEVGNGTEKYIQGPKYKCEYVKAASRLSKTEDESLLLTTNN